MFWRWTMRCLLALLFLGGGASTIFLFFRTSGFAPTGFFACWDADWQKNSLGFCQVSDDGRVIAIGSPLSDTPQRKPSRFQIDFRDVQTWQVVATIQELQHRNQGTSREFGFFKNSQGNRIALVASDGLDFFSWPGCTQIGKRLLAGWSPVFGLQVAFSRDTRVLFCEILPSRIKLWDVELGTELASWPAGPSTIVYFDENDRPKAISFDAPSLNGEVLDLLTAQKSCVLEKSGGFGSGEFALNTQRNLIAIASRNISTNLLGVWSLNDGRSVRPINYTGGLPHALSFSPDGRFLVLKYRLFASEIRSRFAITARTGSWLEEKLYELFLAVAGREEPSPEWRLAVFDLETEASWLDLDEGGSWKSTDLENMPIAFTSDSKKMFVFAKEGRYEWDLPPKLRWFTPWAWVSLAAWLVIAWAFVKAMRSPRFMLTSVHATSSPATTTGTTTGPG